MTIASELKQKIVQATQTKKFTIRQLSKKYKVSSSSVNRILRELGIKTKGASPTFLSKKKQTQIAKEYSKDKTTTIVTLSKKYNVSKSYVWKILKLHGIIPDRQTNRKIDQSLISAAVQTLKNNKNVLATLEKHPKITCLALANASVKLDNCPIVYTKHGKNKYRKRIINRFGLTCNLCGTLKTMNTIKIDHCHESGIVRGLLCNRCNIIVGHVEKVLSVAFHNTYKNVLAYIKNMGKVQKNYPRLPKWKPRM